MKGDLSCPSSQHAARPHRAPTGPVQQKSGEWRCRAVVLHTCRVAGASPAVFWMPAPRALSCWPCCCFCWEPWPFCCCMALPLPPAGFCCCCCWGFFAAPALLPCFCCWAPPFFAACPPAAPPFLDFLIRSSNDMSRLGLPMVLRSAGPQGHRGKMVVEYGKGLIPAGGAAVYEGSHHTYNMFHLHCHMRKGEAGVHCALLPVPQGTCAHPTNDSFMTLKVISVKL